MMYVWELGLRLRVRWSSLLWRIGEGGVWSLGLGVYVGMCRDVWV